MKFTTLLPMALLATFAAAQSNSTEGGGGSAACTTCLQTSLQALPLCKSLNVTGVIGEFDPTGSPAYAACLCSSLDGTWIDTCLDPSKCGADIANFKATYADSMKQAGLVCNGTTPTFNPPPPDTVLPSSTGAGGGAAATDTPKSAGQKEVPLLLTQIVGVVTVAAAIGMNFL
ncbi:hypothetical protein BGZ52_009828 [Haplosporangium bisporale]|nr:hypothetical protein BGZ52_009828 [Haplosporangium bisporale]KAF9205724.1 hypothetical protein BGZ59_000318 [Podila verticillata]KAI9238811.1 MAG: hypothetical protein BYD32DRAFT_412732 [Podila humilis]KFH70461.1 hypothetical protein MVEG_03311 [Podila verticillata NRRL 6337]